jgi:hypothetical protein
VLRSVLLSVLLRTLDSANCVIPRTQIAQDLQKEVL